VSTRGRFYVERNEGDGGGCDIDGHYGTVVNFESKRRSLAEATFCRAYVKRHGGITLYSYPYSMAAPYTPEHDYMNRHMGDDRPAEPEVDGRAPHPCDDPACCSKVAKAERAEQTS
jgi:hypothetical protein